ncbi:hypothetical protein BLA29_009393 [Euroglyphus maynei]|uniref:Uncharacterized protein n=1 Tax=Euroglyphus maynei TaxID=6958 RepID=A0A1Y3BJD1_EURMA|nr:hypothetical protein BLA29_009393 [Euroglyphus maynei]
MECTEKRSPLTVLIVN